MTHQKSSFESGFLKYLMGMSRRRWGFLLLIFFVLFCFTGLPLLFYYSEGGGDIDEITAVINFAVWIVTMAIALFSAVTAFGFESSKKSAYYYHALPLKRHQLFSAHSLVFSIYYISALTVNYLLYMLIALSNHDAGMVSDMMARGFLAAIVIYILFYAIGALAGSICSSRPVQFALAAVLTAICPAYVAGVRLLYEMFSRFSYQGLDSGIWKQTLDTLTDISPYMHIWPLFRQLEGERYTDTEGMLSFSAILALFLLAAVILLGLALLIYRKRKIENAEQPIVFPFAAAAVKYALLFPITLFGGIFFYAVSGNEIAWLVIGFIIGGVAGFLLLNTIIYKSARAMLHGFVGFLSFAAVFVGIVLVTNTAAKYTDNYKADPASVASIELLAPDEFEAVITDKADIAVIIAEFNEARDYALSQSVNNYMTFDGINYYSAEFILVYTIKPTLGIGASLAIPIYDAGMLDKTLEIMYRGGGLDNYFAAQTESTAGKVIASSNQSFYAEIIAFPTDHTYYNPEVYMLPEVSDAEIPAVTKALEYEASPVPGFYSCNIYDTAKLEAALKADLANITFDDFQTPVVGRIGLDGWVPNRSVYMSIPVYKSFTNTLALIGELAGFDPETVFDDAVDLIDKIVVQDYSKGGASTLYDEKAEILELLSEISSYNGDSSNFPQAVNPAGMNLTVTMKDGLEFRLYTNRLTRAKG
jgi:hypothetical protein